MKNFPYSGLIHIRDLDYNTFGLSHNGGTTFVFDIVSSGVSRFHFLLSAACCSPNDNFSRKIGRTIATGRMDAFCSTMEFTSAKQVEHVPYVFEDFFAAYPLETVVGEENISAIEDAISQTDDGVLYIKESDFPLVQNLLEGFFPEVLYSLYGQEFYIFRLANSFIASPVIEQEEE